jgi:hypothetical protein
VSKFIDLTGQQFGRLTVIERAENSNHGHAQWRCVCRCGNETTAKGNNLRSGNSLSCGCKLAEHQKTFTRSRYPMGIDMDFIPSVEDLDDLVKG